MAEPALRHRPCPSYCHYCPDMGGDIMPGCMGGVHFNDLSRCYCEVGGETARDRAASLADEYGDMMPADLARSLREFAASPAPGGRRRMALRARVLANEAAT